MFLFIKNNFLKKVFVKKITIILIVFFVCACDESEKTESATGKSKVLHLRLGHDMPVNTLIHKSIVEFSELVNTRSKGNVEIEIFPNQSLGSDFEMLSMAQKGDLDIILPPTAKLSTIIPSMQLLDLPFIFSSADEVHRVLSGKVGSELLETLNNINLVGAGYWESGFKHFTSDRPLNELADFSKMKFRIMRNEMLREQFQAWGAETMVIDFNSTRNALKDGVVNGQENPLGSIYGKGLYEVQSHLTLSYHGYLAQVLAFSKIQFDKWPPDVKNILLSSAREVMKSQWKEAKIAENNFLEDIKKSKIKINLITPELKSQLKEKSRVVLEKYRMKIGSELIEKLLESLDENRIYSDNELVVALDADMAGNSSLSGLAIKRGIELAVDEINAAGGLLGKNLVVTARDNSMVSARGVDNLNRFSEIPNLLAVFGGISSPVVLSELKT
ncbi:MAG: DctP family TRAP transporter solute-binding subunit, partial [Gammaproteobacteria bacterium]|nr:DctP family TRAP transporter solute-binding subunit [Gammaproteobacteria bacterium]